MQRDDTLRWACAGQWLTLAGAILSGPVALFVVGATHPQPAWRDSATFAAHYHPIQTLPFFLGFVLVGGLVIGTTSLSCLAPAGRSVRARVAVAVVSAFAALVFLNYIAQTTFVPLLVAGYREADAPIVSALTMTNPNSLGWCIEMWAYALAGVATWLSGAVFDRGGVEKFARLAFVTNGPVSLGSALATAWIPGWALTRVGLVAFATWNLLLVVMCGLALVALHARRVAAASAAESTSERDAGVVSPGAPPAAATNSEL